MTYFIVVGRVSGDDEDSCNIVEADTAEDAEVEFKNWIANLNDIEIDDSDYPIYVNYVIQSETQPVIVSGPFG